MPKINLDCLLIMGVAGAGKTTVGKLLANSIGGTFMDGDDFHSGHNIEKMKRGIPLTDADRHRWLIEISRQIRDHPGPSKLVIACSALKGSYRKILGCDNFHLVYLKGNKKEIAKRLACREGHFMPAKLLDSQMIDLEEPKGALTISISSSPPEIVEKILSNIGWS